MSGIMPIIKIFLVFLGIYVSIILYYSIMAIIEHYRIRNEHNIIDGDHENPKNDHNGDDVANYQGSKYLDS